MFVLVVTVDVTFNSSFQDTNFLSVPTTVSVSFQFLILGYEPCSKAWRRQLYLSFNSSFQDTRRGTPPILWVLLTFNSSFQDTAAACVWLTQKLAAFNSSFQDTGSKHVEGVAYIHFQFLILGYTNTGESLILLGVSFQFLILGYRLYSVQLVPLLT